MNPEPKDAIDILREVAQGAVVQVDLLAVADELARLRGENAALRRALADARFRMMMGGGGHV